MSKKRLKSLIASCLAVCLLLSLTACGGGKDKDKNNNADGTKKDKYGCVTVLGTSWGMSIDDCISALKLKKEDLSIKTQVGGLSSFSVEKEIYGAKATISFMFQGKENEGTIDLGLYQVDATYTDAITAVKVKEEIKKAYDAQGAQFEEIKISNEAAPDMEVVSFRNNKLVSGIEDGIKTKYTELMITMGARDAQWVEESIFQNSISSVDIFIAGANVSKIEFKGSESAYINYLSK